MSVALWILQALLGVHTAIGAFWKVSTPAQAIPSLAAIPRTAWMALAGVEILCAAVLLGALVLPRLAPLVPVAAGLVALEMLGFAALHLGSGEPGVGPLVYWLVVAVPSLGLAVARAR